MHETRNCVSYLGESGELSILCEFLINRLRDLDFILRIMENHGRFSTGKRKDKIC